MNSNQLLAYALGACLSNLPTSPKFKTIKNNKSKMPNTLGFEQVNFWVILGVLPRSQKKNLTPMDSVISPMVFPGIHKT